MSNGLSEMDPGYCENYAVIPSFSSISPYLCKTSCPKHDIKLHNYALTITMTTHGTCLWSRYPVLVIICELEVLTSVEQAQVYSIYYTVL